MENDMKIYVIVVTYKGMRWYDKCFSSLRESTIPVQIIVVDNTPGEEDANYIKTNFPEIHLIKTEENLGFGKANNIGMRYALDHGCDYVFLLNQDAWIFPPTIETIVRTSQLHPEFGIISPIQCNCELTQVHNGVIDFLANPEQINHDLFSDIILGTIKDIYSIKEMNAAAWLLPRKTLEVVGGFDPIFLHYGEDWNYLSRVLFHGFKVGLMPRVYIVHDSAIHVDRPKGYDMNFEKWLLQRASDVLYPDVHVKEMIRHYWKMAIFKLLCLHKATFLENWRAYKFLKIHKKELAYSREINKKKGTNWL